MKPPFRAFASKVKKCMEMKKGRNITLDCGTGDFSILFSTELLQDRKEVLSFDSFIEFGDIESIYSYRVGREMASAPFGRYFVFVPTHGVENARKRRSLKFAGRRICSKFDGNLVISRDHKFAGSFICCRRPG